MTLVAKIAKFSTCN